MRYGACSYYRPMPSKQGGAVLVLAMVVMILVSMLAVEMASQLEFSARQGSNRLHGGQAREYLHGAESLGLAVLARDSRSEAALDHLGEDWARQVPEFPVDGGWVRAQLADAQGRLNLNTLAAHPRGRSAAAGEAARFTAAQRRFIRLLQALGEDAPAQVEAIAITEALIDWLDSDDDVTGYGGAEADYYLQLAEPYRPANRLMADRSELRRVRYVTEELYRQLEPYVVALAAEQPLNINTAPLVVIQTINRQSELAPMDSYSAERIVAARDEGMPFASIESFLRHEQVMALNTVNDVVTSEGLAIRSDYYLLRAESEVMGRYRAMRSVLRRDAGGGRVVRRSQL